MYDAGKIIIGLIAFLVLITFPMWYNAVQGKAAYAPELEKPTKSDVCVRDADWMRAHHMDLLNTWRDQVVRQGIRYEQTEDGGQIERSLTNTCLNCHENKDRFCDACHTYMGVEPYCWDCHVVPKEYQP